MKIIFDTDIGCDCDDVLALCLLLSADKNGDCELAAVNISSPYPTAAGCIGAILHQYGRDDIPVGSLVKPFEGYYPNADVYSGGVAEAFPNKTECVSDAVTLMRCILAGADERVTLLATGPQPNIAALLESVPDDISPLDGITLCMAKLDKIVIMGGDFSHENKLNPTTEDCSERTEFNISLDIKSAQTVLSKSPVDVVYLPFEAANRMISGGEMVEKFGRNQPSSLALILHGSEHGRDSWDPASALYAVYGTGNDFIMTPRGEISMPDSGVCYFKEKENGKHRYLMCARPMPEIAAHIDSVIAL